MLFNIVNSGTQVSRILLLLYDTFFFSSHFGAYVFHRFGGLDELLIMCFGEYNKIGKKYGDYTILYYYILEYCGEW